MARTISPPYMPQQAAPAQHQHAHHHAHGHAHHGHQHQPQQPLQGQPNQMMMQVVQMPDGNLGLAPWTPPPPPQQATPQQLGQVAPQPSWGGLALVMGGLGIAGWWAWKKWIKGDTKGAGSSSFSDERPRSDYSGYSRRRSGEYRSSEARNRSAYNRLDERRSRRSRTRMLAEYKRYLDSQGIND